MSEYAEKIQQKAIEKDKEIRENLSEDELGEEETSPMGMLSTLLSPDEEKEGRDEVIKLLFEHPDLRKIADVTPNELVDLTVLSVFARDMNVPLIDYFVETRLALSLSKNRKSREEVVEIYKTQMYGEMGMMSQSDSSSPNRWQRMKDRFGV